MTSTTAEEKYGWLAETFSIREWLGDRRYQALGTSVGLSRITGFNHDPQQRLCAAGTNQNAAALAKFGLDHLAFKL